MKILSNKPTITRKELEGVLDCMIHEELTTGSTVKNFETAIATITGKNYSLGVNSLTSAYILLFKSLEIKPDDEVIIPSFSNNTPISAMDVTGGVPIIIDSDSNSIFPSIEQIKEKVNNKTKAIIVSDTFGFHFEGETLKDLNIPIIVDISHSIGTEMNDQPAGSYGTFIVASFAPSMIVTTGNGGIILTNNSKYFSLMRDLRGYKEDIINYDFTMTDLQGAMGISQILKLKDFLKRRREIAGKYHESVRLTSHKTIYTYNESFAYQSFPLIFDAPSDRVEKYWKKNNIEALRALPYPCHNLLKLKNFDYPNADRMSKKLYTLPLYPTLTKKEIEKISKSLAEFI